MNFFRLQVLSCGFALMGASSFQIAQAQSKGAAPAKSVAAKANVSPSKNPAQPVFKLDALPIAALPQVPVEFEFVGTQKDLLGIVQQVARGIAIENPKPASPNANTKAQLFSGDDLSDIVRDIHFLRAQSFNFLKMEEMQDEARAKAPTMMPAPPSGSMMTSPEEFLNSMNPKRPKHVDVQEFYGKSFRAQKGNRQLFANNNETTIAVWVFEAPRSWALVTQGPSRAIVVRADGFPRLEAIGRLFKMQVNQ